MKLIRGLFIPFLLLLSCGGSSEDQTPKVFESDGSPAFMQNVSGDYYLCEPWSFNNQANSQCKYPLFVYLHGAGSDGVPDILPCFNNDADKKAYPAFVYLPHASGSWDNSKIILQIESIISEYPRIDVNRIYLMGYSMGGSGSYALANEYFDSKQRLFAGIVRMAGQSQTIVRNAIADRTSIWYHVGLSDTAERVTVAKDAFQFLKEYAGNSMAEERSDAVTIDSYPGITLTLTKDGVEIVKYTEYDEPVGHGISHFPLTDPYLLEWLFSQSLKNR